MGQDEQGFEVLIEQSQDMHSDSMRVLTPALGELVEIGRPSRAEAAATQAAPADTVDGAARSVGEQRRRAVRIAMKLGGALALGGVGAALADVLAGPASAAPPVQSSAAPAPNLNVQALQTSASIENLAVFTYTKVLALPFVAKGNALVKRFVTLTMQQHAAHAVAFNNAATGLGGKSQTNPNPVLMPKVQAALPGLGDVSQVMVLATALERTASETYAKNCQLMTDAKSRELMSSILGVDCQHVTMLLAFQALLTAPGLIAVPTSAPSLPAPIGGIGFPDAFLPTSPTYARVPSEGAVA